MAEHAHMHLRLRFLLADPELQPSGKREHRACGNLAVAAEPNSERRTHREEEAFGILRQVSPAARSSSVPG